jgi:hypothetical protein
MKKLGLSLVLGSLIVFVINFLTLFNRNFTTDKILMDTGSVIMLISFLGFNGGLLLTLVCFLKQYLKHHPDIHPKSPRGGQVEKSVFSPFELRIRIIFGLLIIFFSLTNFLWGFLFIPIAIIFGLYLIKSKKRHLVAELPFTVFGTFIYFVHVPLVGMSPVYFKMFLYNVDFNYLMLGSMLSVAFFAVMAVFLLTMDILELFINKYESVQRPVGMVSIFFIILLIFFLIPLFIPFQLQAGFPRTMGAGGCPPWNDAFKMKFGQIKETGMMNLKYNNESKNYIYQIKTTNQIQEAVRIQSLRGAIYNFGVFNFFPRKETLIPGVSDKLIVEGGERANGEIIVNPEEQVILTITSHEPFASLVLQDSYGCKYSFGFLEKK